MILVPTKFFMPILAVVLVMNLTSCGLLNLILAPTTTQVTTVSVSVSPTTATLVVGDSTTLKAAVLPANSNDPVVWTTSKPSVASVNSAGVVVALAAGSAVITANSGAKSSNATITVLGTGSGLLGFTWGNEGLNFDQSHLDLPLGGSATTLAPSAEFDTSNTSDWNWVIDGQVEGTDSTYLFDPATAGFYTISVTVLKNDTYYSGSLTVTVGQ